MPLTADMLRELVSYDPETGIVTWLARDRKYFPNDSLWRAWNRKCAGQPAGYTQATGYASISIFDRGYRSHRLVWLYMTGNWPAGEIDHIDHNRGNNRFANLRDVSRSQNCRNVSRQNRRKDHIVGVVQEESGKWRAHMTVDGKYVNLGLFENRSDAAAARQRANRKYGFHENHGASVAPKFRGEQ